jgi:hypothetical protein
MQTYEHTSVNNETSTHSYELLKPATMTLQTAGIHVQSTVLLPVAHAMRFAGRTCVRISQLYLLLQFVKYFTMYVLASKYQDDDDNIYTFGNRECSPQGTCYGCISKT